MEFKPNPERELLKRCMSVIAEHNQLHPVLPEIANLLTTKEYRQRVRVSKTSGGLFHFVESSDHNATFVLDADADLYQTNLRDGIDLEASIFSDATKDQGREFNQGIDRSMLLKCLTVMSEYDVNHSLVSEIMDTLNDKTLTIRVEIVENQDGKYQVINSCWWNGTLIFDEDAIIETIVYESSPETKELVDEFKKTIEENPVLKERVASIRKKRSEDKDSDEPIGIQYWLNKNGRKYPSYEPLSSIFKKIERRRAG